MWEKTGFFKKVLMKICGKKVACIFFNIYTDNSLMYQSKKRKKKAVKAAG